MPAAIAVCLPLAALAPSAHAVSLANLFAGGSLTAGNARFTNWELLSLDDTSPPLPNLALIDVTPLVDALPQNPGIRFAANGQLAVAGVNAIDLHLRFRVEALGGTSSFVGQTLAVTAATFTGGGGTLFVSGDLSSRGGSSSTVAILDNETPFFQATDTTTFAASSQVSVTMNAFVTGIGQFDDLSLGAFTQRFQQTGPPGLLGDYNDDGTVNAADYVVYRNRKSGVGGNTLINEFATQGLVTVDDYLFWKMQYGLGAGGGAVRLGASAEVPEPSAAWCLAALCVAVGLRRSRGREGFQPAEGRSVTRR